MLVCLEVIYPSGCVDFIQEIFRDTRNIIPVYFNPHNINWLEFSAHTGITEREPYIFAHCQTQFVGKLNENPRNSDNKIQHKTPYQENTKKIRFHG